jgi:hypothetical protein
LAGDPHAATPDGSAVSAAAVDTFGRALVIGILNTLEVSVIGVTAKFKSALCLPLDRSKPFTRHLQQRQPAPVATTRAASLRHPASRHSLAGPQAQMSPDLGGFSQPSTLALHGWRNPGLLFYCRLSLRATEANEVVRVDFNLDKRSPLLSLWSLWFRESLNHSS